MTKKYQNAFILEHLVLRSVGFDSFIAVDISVHAPEWG